MNFREEAIWRAALERRGEDWVARELRSRPGQPGDEMLDVVFEQPHPTRAFCQTWCAEQQNRMFSMSGHTKVVIAALIVLFAVTARAVIAWDNYQPPKPDAWGNNLPVQINPLPGPATGGGDTLQDPSRGPVPSDDNSASSSPPRTSISSCTYATYPTAGCLSR